MLVVCIPEKEIFWNILCKADLFILFYFFQFDLYESYKVEKKVSNP